MWVQATYLHTSHIDIVASNSEVRPGRSDRGGGSHHGGGCDDDSASATRGGSAYSVFGDHGVGVGASEVKHEQQQQLLPASVQLRRLVDRHRQLHTILQGAGLRVAVALRRDLLRPPHRPLVRRPPHRRLHRGEAGVPVLAGVPAGQVAGDEGRLPVRRQLRSGERHSTQPAPLQEEAAQRGPDHPLLPGHPDRVVQESAGGARLHRRRAAGDHGELAVPGGGDRCQRLQPPLLPELDAGVRPAAGAPGDQVHRALRGGPHQAGRQEHLRAGHLPAGLRAAVPLLLPRRRAGRLRLRRLPPVAQRPHRRPQPHAQGQAPGARARPPRRVHHLRGLLQRGAEPHHQAGGERVRPGDGAARVLRRRRAVQRQPHPPLLGPGGGAVPGAGEVRVVGRPAHDGGGVQDHGPRDAPRPLRQPVHHVHMQPHLAELARHLYSTSCATSPFHLLGFLGFFYGALNKSISPGKKKNKYISK